MKALHIILLLTFANYFFAQNNLRLFSADGKLFTVFVDGKAINQPVQANVLLSSINKDTLKFVIELEDKLKSEGTAYFLDKGKPVKNKEFNYLVESKAGKIKIVFAGIKDIIALPNPLVPVKPVVDTSSKYRDNILEHYCELKEGKPFYYNNVIKGKPCLESMKDSYINYMNILMAKTSLQDDKFTIAENTIRNNCVNTAQLQKILGHIEYELEKLKLIKLAYYHVTDKANLNSLTQSMKLESAKNELLDFLKTAPQDKEGIDKNCTIATSESVMSEFYKTLGVCTNDSERFSVFKKKYEEYCYSESQVKLVLSQFIHDREKLDVAKMLYFYCTNKQNYMNISDAFSYTTSVAELKSFVNNQN